MSILEQEIKLLKSLTITMDDVETFNQIVCDENFTNEAVMWQPLDTEQIENVHDAHDKQTLKEVNRLFEENKLDVAYIVASY